MDLTQSKLNKEEWTALEVPLPEDENRILKMIRSGWDNPQISYNDANSIVLMMRITENIDIFHDTFYEMYFKEKISSMNKKYNVSWKENKSKKKKKKLKKKEEIRIKNFDKKLSSNKDSIYEYILIKNAKSFLSHFKSKHVSKYIYYYYNLSQLILNNIKHINIIVMDYIKFILSEYETKINMKDIIINSSKYIEQNKILLQYKDYSLYKHQSDMITTFKNSSMKQLVLYQAPTGTGKTMTPIGLSKGKRIIFVCAAKHIGLQLAKSCISLEIPIAIAFGCKDPGDIRLHYYAAKDYTKNYKTGAIFKVDNSVGDKVDIIISDIQSYLSAMNYMCAFNKEEDLIWYWDEPTITLDYESHEFHSLLQKNWNENRIPNIVLSSATLPNMDELTDMLQSYKYKFPDSKISEILSYECQKSIPIISKEGYKVLPHYQYSSWEQIKACLSHLEKNKTIMRYFDVNEISKFIVYVLENKFVKPSYYIENYFDNIYDINVINIKLYYLVLLKKCKKNYEEVYNYFQKQRSKKYDSTIKITTNDAHTLTDGPTIFLTKDVKKLASIYLKASQIPGQEMERLRMVIQRNDKWREELNKVEEVERQRKDKQGSEMQEKTHKMDSTEFKLLEQYYREVKRIKSKIETVELNQIYVPNTNAHLRKWSSNQEITKEFTSDIDDDIIEEIMMLNISQAWKILLLMGIGVFIKHENTKYVEIMKKLAEDQKLYLIIASSDYIYGTNYQFCHGYLGRDLQNMTQEKMIQAFGRVGRRNNQMDYTIRLRDDSLIDKLFMKEKDKIEVRNMNMLFA
tara:strand:+ start:2161 stop:4554 length:2394 start_codon:yes stop_codon:yes gene_type:complete